MRCLISVLALLPAFAVQAADFSAGGASFVLPVTSLKEARFRTTVRQQYDFSCGSAALATLLSHHYDFQVTEQEIFRDMTTRFFRFSAPMVMGSNRVLIRYSSHAQ